MSPKLNGFSGRGEAQLLCSVSVIFEVVYMMCCTITLGKVTTKLSEYHFWKRPKVGIHNHARGSILETTRAGGKSRGNCGGVGAESSPPEAWDPSRSREHPKRDLGTQAGLKSLPSRLWLSHHRAAILGILEKLEGKVGCWSQGRTGTQLLNMEYKFDLSHLN